MNSRAKSTRRICKTIFKGSILSIWFYFMIKYVCGVDRYIEKVYILEKLQAIQHNTNISKKYWILVGNWSIHNLCIEDFSEFSQQNGVSWTLNVIESNNSFNRSWFHFQEIELSARG